MRPVPLSLVRAGRELTEPRISPDGSMVGFVQRWRGGSSINIVALDAPPVERQLTFGPDPAPGRGLGGGCFTWIPDADRGSIIYVADDGELWRQAGPELDRLTAEGRPVRAPSMSADNGRLVAYAVDEAEVWLLDIETGVARRLDDGRSAFCFDPAMSPDARTVSWIGWSPPDMAWDGAVRLDADIESGHITAWSLADGAFQQPRFTPTGAASHVHDGSGWLNVHVGDDPVVAETVEHAGPTWGMGNRTYAFDSDGRQLAFTRNERGAGSLCVIERETGAVDEIARSVHGHLSWAGDHLVALRTGARTPTQIVDYRLPGWDRTTVAFTHPDAWELSELPEPELIDEPSDDARLVLHARRFVAGSGRMLVFVHGGPTDQWQVDWRPRITYWWSRGWDVLVVDPRGTTGHGRVYQQALHGGWGRFDVSDTATLIRRGHRERWATPASTVIIGGSSGGLTVLGLLADHPDLVSGGVASYPVSDLRALTEATHRFEAHYTDRLVAPDDGSPESDATFEELSPLHRADRMTKPLLVMHGADDPVVPVAQSEALARTVRDAGGDVELVVYDGEGHGFRRAEHVADEYTRIERFLDRVRG